MDLRWSCGRRSAFSADLAIVRCFSVLRLGRPHSSLNASVSVAGTSFKEDEVVQLTGKRADFA